MIYLATGVFLVYAVWALACELAAGWLIERATGRALKGWLRR
jgi:hypothetical protein